MGLQNAQIIEGATVAFSGGVAKSFTVNGTKVNNGIQISDTSVTDVRTRPTISLSSKPAVYNSQTAAWSIDKREISVTRPKVDGELQLFPAIKVGCNYVAQMTAAEKLELRKMTAQALLDPDFDAFHDTGSLA